MATRPSGPCASCPGRDALPIVALTANVAAGESQRCIDAGASAYVSKPVDTDELLALLVDRLRPAASRAHAVMRCTSRRRRSADGAPILVVDDSVGSRLAIRAMLAPLGHPDRRGRIGPRRAARRAPPDVRADPDGRPDADDGRLRDRQADPAAQRDRSARRSSSSRRFGRDEMRDGRRVRQRRRRLHLHADPPGRAAGEGLGVRRPVRAGPGAAALGRVDHGAQRRAARQRGARARRAAERRRRDRHRRRGRADRVVQPVRPAAVRLPRGRGRSAARSS